jgi:hypothetical protein
VIQEPPFKFFPLPGEIHGRVTRRTAGFSVPGFAVPPPFAHASAVIEGLLDGRTTMREFCGKNHLSRSIINDGDPGGFAARIKLDAQRCDHRLLDLGLQNDGKRVPAID